MVTLRFCCSSADIELLLLHCRSCGWRDMRLPKAALLLQVRRQECRTTPLHLLADLTLLRCRNSGWECPSGT